MALRDILKSVFLLFILLFIWFIFEDKLMRVFDEKILPLLADLKISTITTILFFLIILLPIYGIYKSIKNRFHISYQIFTILFFITFIYIKYRSSGTYISIPSTIFGLGYTDVIVMLLIIFLISSFYSFCSDSHKKVNNGNYSFIPDTPISSPDPQIDILEYSESAKRLANDLENIQLETSYSIGLISPWGTGKTSYLNLLEYHLDKDKFIVLNFNPRNSRSAINIQEDFFDELFSKLGSYDFRFSSAFKDYLKAISVINENKIISFLFNIHKIWNKEDEKEQINNAILRLNKKIVVIIEDFDRLLSNEIIEVFKLIDGNASFSNIIFVTAYDKKHINNIIGETYSNEESLFSDKFFNLEIQIPLRPYDKIYKYIEEHLLAGFNIRTEEEDLYKSTLRNYFDLLKKYITTLRDAKKFLNLFIHQYVVVKEEVEFRDYFLLYLIKYKYLDEYLQLYKKDIISTNNQETSSYMNLNTNSEMKSKDILEILFPANNVEHKLRSINNAMAFDIYFYENVYGHLKLSEMGRIFDDDNDYRQTIQEFISQNSFQDFLSFLDSKNILVLHTKKRFERYIDVWFYLFINNYETVLSYFRISGLINTQQSKEIQNIYSYTEKDYKTFITNKLQGSYPDYPYQIVRRIIMGIINNELNTDVIFSKEDLLNIAKVSLNNCIQKDKYPKQLHIDLLYNCTTDINQDTRHVTLDSQACLSVRELIIQNPAEYFNKFVRLGMVSYNKDFNSVACEPFWEQIFGNSDNFEKFLIFQNEVSIPKINLVKNFWKLYKNNNYHPIEFQNQGDVQEKINEGLVKEIEKLNRLLDIEKELQNDEVDKYASSMHRNTVNLEKYKRFLSVIDENKLFITKTVEIRRKIQSFISSMS